MLAQNFQACQHFLPAKGNVVKSCKGCIVILEKVRYTNNEMFLYSGLIF